MTSYEKSLNVIKELFGKDVTFSLATSRDDIPAIRVVDVFYDDGAFWIVTNKKSNKAMEIENNPNCTLCDRLYRFTGKAYIAGHPCEEKNKQIRGKLIKAFEPWYFAHNNEDDENMCYIRVDLQEGFFYKDGTGYSINFIKKTVNEFPFEDHTVTNNNL